MSSTSVSTLLLLSGAVAGPGAVDYCAVDSPGAALELVRPAAGEAPIDDVNWFARPVPNELGHHVVAFASHNLNYLYDLTTGAKIRIPDRSDAVATPDGRYVTVPSHYTPDEYIRFYDASVLLDHLARGEDADEVAPVFVHEHPDLRKVYYQSAGVVSSETRGTTLRTVYRLMFSGTRDEAGFRIVDYEFLQEKDAPLAVYPSAPMKLCPEIRNDLNTPFISKDARYVASYTSSSPKSEYSNGSSLKIYRIDEVTPETGSTRCEEVVDFGFAAGKADFSFDGSMLAFHISQGGYLTPFVSGGLASPTVTDVVVVKLTRSPAGELTGYSDVARVTTSTRKGVGSYFPAFFPDGKLFYIANAEPKNSESPKRFSFKVVDPKREIAMASVFGQPERLARATELGQIWSAACTGETFAEHEAPWVLSSLSRSQCLALVLSEKVRKERKSALATLCQLRPE